MSDYIKTLEYYFEDGSHIIFEKYTIDTLGIIKNKKSGQTPSYGNETYNKCGVYDDNGKKRKILVGRAVASTFLGKPPTLEHTADHIISNQKKNDALTNIRWNCKKGQANNQIRPETYKAASIIVKDGVEKTMNEWIAHMNATKTPGDREFTKNMITYYAKQKQRGFAYKEYPDLEGEKWKEIGEEFEDSETKRGRWKISNMNRVKYIAKMGTENVLWGERLRRQNGYPVVKINGKHWMCHILAFAAFHPEIWATKGLEKEVLHENDDKEDFRPHKLRLGTASVNRKDAHDNGKYDDTKSARKKCASYINDVLEKVHLSLTDAAEHLKNKGYSKASQQCIGMALSGVRITAYGRTWENLR